jgi:hypothetical protein
VVVVVGVQLCDGASPEERARWFLKPAQQFHYLNQSTCYEIPGDSNAEEYQVCVCVVLDHQPAAAVVKPQVSQHDAQQLQRLQFPAPGYYL